MCASDEKKYWKSPDDLNSDSTSLQTKQDEFAEELFTGVGGTLLDEMSSARSVSRRDFLKLMGFGVAAVSAAACSRMPIQKAIPYLSKPEEIVPGVSYWYASTCAGCTANCGLLVKNRDGRPIKIEGNPQSPLNSGGVCAVGQASVLELYDSGRLHHPLYQGNPISWIESDAEIIKRFDKIQTGRGNVRIVSQTLTSPATKKIIDSFLSQFSNGKHIVYDSVSSSALIEAHQFIFGQPILPHYLFDQADVIVGIGADFLGTWISPVEFTSQYVKHRTLNDQQKMSRHFQFETQLSLTGANADVRVPIKPSEEGLVALGILNDILQASGGSPSESVTRELARERHRKLATFIKQASKELLLSRGQSIIVSASNDVHIQMSVAKINQVLGNYGRTLDIQHPSQQKQGLDSAMTELISEMSSGDLDAVILYDVNPAYDYPHADVFKQALHKVDLTISFARHADETAILTQFVCPDHNSLESWNDAQPVVGIYHLTQPLISPIYDTRSAQDSLLKWQGLTPDYYSYLKAYWQENVFPMQNQHLLFSSFWDKSVHDGVFISQETRRIENPVSWNIDAASSSAFNHYVEMQQQSKPGTLEISFIEKIGMRDGRHANNPWLQELPDPISKITWDNYISLPLDFTHAQGLKEGDVVSLTVGQHTIELPVVPQPGQAIGTASIALGYGRQNAGKVGRGVGKNLFPCVAVRSGRRSYFAIAAQLKKTGRNHTLAATQTHHSMEGRPIVKETTLAQYIRNPQVAVGETSHNDLHMLWQQHDSKGHSWGMVIDLNACTGCSACVVSCQAENNVPVVGKEEVGRQREMYWIRMDRYYSESPDNPDVVFQPMMCQHCANAPCESVCPVIATVHSTDGLNQQVYNRCIGTRYCANNCPYKVRRFNWFDYANNNKFDYNMNDELGRMVLNPDIVVRSRGVMEKCSMCVQRIQEGKLQAKKEGRDLNDSDIKTACQQSCPANAIVFGDLADPDSQISQILKNNSRRYQVLSELNVKPAVNYLAKVRNKE